MESILRNFWNLLVCSAIVWSFPAISAAETAVAGPVDATTSTTNLVPDTIWLIGLALIAVVAITRRRLK